MISELRAKVVDFGLEPGFRGPHPCHRRHNSLQYLVWHRTHRGASWASGAALAAQFVTIILRCVCREFTWRLSRLAYAWEHSVAPGSALYHMRQTRDLHKLRTRLDSLEKLLTKVFDVVSDDCTRRRRRDRGRAHRHSRSRSRSRSECRRGR